jgi:hypothetical protein
MPDRVRHLALALFAVVAALAVLPATGEAAKLRYHTCDGKKYQLLIDPNGPTVKLLRIKMRKAKADGYAPRCLVAEAVAANVIDDGGKPATINVYGARWGVGKYKCTYAEKSELGYVQVACVHTGKDANTVRFRLLP